MTHSQTASPSSLLGEKPEHIKKLQSALHPPKTPHAIEREYMYRSITKMEDIFGFGDESAKSYGPLTVNGGKQW